MPNTREVRMRIKSVKNIAQVTSALQAVSASKVRKSMQAMYNTRPYATKAWEVLKHLAAQPGRESLHPLLTTREKINNVTVVVITGDRGLAGAYTTNIIRFVHHNFDNYKVPVRYVAIGRKGRELLLRAKKNIVAEFSNLPAAPTFNDVSAIGHVVVEDFLDGKTDEVYIVYTKFINLVLQEPTVKKLLPLEVAEHGKGRVTEFDRPERTMAAAYIYEPNQMALLDKVVPRFTALQIYQAIMESLASEHAARMVAMRNATESATALAHGLQLEYNKVRQQTITNEMLDIAGGAEALAKSS